VSYLSWLDHPRGVRRGRRGSAKTSYDQRARILLVGPMPPTKGGIATFMLNLMVSYLNEQFEFVPYQDEAKSENLQHGNMAPAEQTPACGIGCGRVGRLNQQVERTADPKQHRATNHPRPDRLEAHSQLRSTSSDTADIYVELVRDRGDVARHRSEAGSMRCSANVFLSLVFSEFYQLSLSQPFRPQHVCNYVSFIHPHRLIRSTWRYASTTVVKVAAAN
jgi:hypothetical protein